MAAIVMDGKALAAKIKEEVRLRVEQMERKPGMAMVLVGENPAAQVYEAGKEHRHHAALPGPPPGPVRHGIGMRPAAHPKHH